MSIAVATIVEGHGEVTAVRTLIGRILEAFRPYCECSVLRPIRVPKSKLLSDTAELLRAVDLGTLKLSEAQCDSGVVLLLLDSDNDAACQIGPRVTQLIREERPNIDFACVLAVKEFETWLIGGGQGLAELLTDGFEIPQDPEESGVGKGWIERYFAGAKYSESVDQVRLTARFDVFSARNRCRSFDKLCRELERRCG